MQKTPTIQTQPERKNGHKPEAGILPKQKKRFGTMTDLSGELLSAYGNENIVNQTMWLEDSRLHAIQRQTMAAEVGQIQGNQRLQRLVSKKGAHRLAISTIPDFKVVQRDDDKSPATDTTTDTPGAADIAATPDLPQLPDQDEYTHIINEEIQKSLEAFENIEITVPAMDPKVAPTGSSQPASSTGGSASTGTASATPTVLTVRTQYWINKRHKARDKELSKRTNKALKKLFKGFPKNAKVGKSSPEEIRSSTQKAMDLGLIRGPRGSWPPGKGDIEAWMGKVGLGVDCSGFVFQALTNANQTLVTRGAQGMQKELKNGITETGSGSLYGMGTKVKSPSELRAGDVMYLTPKPIGHIRIITSVTPSGDGIEFSTAESSSSAKGPVDVKWLYPDASKFKKLKVYKSKWTNAGSRDQKAKFSHHFAATPEPLK